MSLQEPLNYNTLINELSTTKNTLYLLDFTASWCGPCQKIHPRLLEYQQLYSQSRIKFYKIDVDNQEHSSTCDHFNISAMPTIIFVYNNIVVHSVVGSDLNEIKSVLDNYK
jgi:thioredoxin 1